MMLLLQMVFEADENLVKIQVLEQQVQEAEHALAVNLLILYTLTLQGIVG